MTGPIDPRLSSRDPHLPGPDASGKRCPAREERHGESRPTSIARSQRSRAASSASTARSATGRSQQRNHGSHYGFIEEGVIFSKLQPGLATVLVMNDGAVDLKTWMPPDEAQLARVRYARQNGVPLIEFDAAHGTSMPGQFVNLWGPGNWSGSANEDLRTLRAGLCLQENGSQPLPDLRLFLIRHALGHGPGLPGVSLPLRHAIRHQRAGAYLSRTLRAPRPAST